MFCKIICKISKSHKHPILSISIYQIENKIKYTLTCRIVSTWNFLFQTACLKFSENEKHRIHWSVRTGDSVIFINYIRKRVRSRKHLSIPFACAINQTTNSTTRDTFLRYTSVHTLALHLSPLFPRSHLLTSTERLVHYRHPIPECFLFTPPRIHPPVVALHHPPSCPALTLFYKFTGTKSEYITWIDYSNSAPLITEFYSARVEDSWCPDSRWRGIYWFLKKIQRRVAKKHTELEIIFKMKWKVSLCCVRILIYRLSN